MRKKCPSTEMFKKFREKFARGFAAIETEKKAMCSTDCFAGRMKSRIFKKLERDQKYREEIRRGIVKNLSILFVDIRGFSTRTALMEPEKIVRLLDLFIPEMLNIIVERHKGTVDKLLGDGIMALYGHPYETGEEIIQAIHSAIDMQQVSAAMAEVLKISGHDPIEIGVGINKGEVLICEVGNETYREATVIGAPVNLAAKMEDVAQANEIALPMTVLPEIERVNPDLIKYIENKGHHHGVDVVTLDWISYIENRQE